MDVKQLIYDAIDEINHDLNEEEKIAKTDDTALFGTGDSLDSLQLVNLITIVEQRLEEETGDFISLADERAMSMDQSPFKTIGTLEQYITSLLNERKV